MRKHFKVTMRLPKILLDEIDRIVPKGKRSKFIAEALAKEFALRKNEVTSKITIPRQ